MKLYTEEQLQEAYNRGHIDGTLNNKDYSITDGFIPIELPSDEEIEKNSTADKNFDYVKSNEKTLPMLKKIYGDSATDKTATFQVPKKLKGILKSYTPIELPTDEQIEAYLNSFPFTKHLDDGQYNDGVIVGAELGIEWLKEQINKQL